MINSTVWETELLL